MRNGKGRREQIRREERKIEIGKGVEDRSEDEKRRIDVYSPPKRDEREDRLGEDRSERNRTE